MSDATLLPDDEPYIADAGAGAGVSAGLGAGRPAGTTDFVDPADGGSGFGLAAGSAWAGSDAPAGGRVGTGAGLDAGPTGAGFSLPATGDDGVRVMSAGGLVFRRRDGDRGIETLLCGRIRPGCSGGNAGRSGCAGAGGNAGGGGIGGGAGYASGAMSWRLPKGTPEPGESVAETARREVQEETGVCVRVVAPIASIRYFFVGHEDGVRYDKTVHFYLMQPLGGDTANHDAEFDVVEWHRYEDALALLEYGNERSVLETARYLIDEHGIEDCRVGDYPVDDAGIETRIGGGAAPGAYREGGGR